MSKYQHIRRVGNIFNRLETLRNDFKESHNEEGDFCDEDKSNEIHETLYHAAHLLSEYAAMIMDKLNREED